jgi:hypothetical protein
MGRREETHKEKKSTDQAEEILAVDCNRLVWITLFFS